MAVRGTVDANAGGTLVTSVTGTAGQITASPTTGAVVVALANNAAIPGSPTTTTQAATDNSTNIATTAYVTTGIANAIAGVNPAVAVQAATTAASNTSGFTYNNGVGGIGATFTGSVNTAVTIDGYTFTALGQRLLVKNDTQAPSGAFNGVFYVTQVQTAILAPILARALDYDQPSDINNTGAIPVINGTVNGTTQWILTSTVNIVGTDPLTFTKFSLNPGTVSSVLGQSGVPMIVVGSGSMANNGALTLTTSLTANPAITSAYVSLPAGAIAAGVPASPTWYYALFSSATVAQVYNNIYMSGTPVIPASPAAFVTTGPGAYTGSSSTITAYSYSLVGNTLGINGGLRIDASWSYTNSAANKTMAILFGNMTLVSTAATTTASAGGIFGFKNAGAANLQLSSTNQSLTAGGLGTSTAAIVSGTVDTTTAQTVAFNLTNATPASNNLVLATATIELLPSVA